MNKLIKKNPAPEWFCQDIKNNVAEAEIKKKIYAELHDEAIRRKYDMEFCDDYFLNKMTNLYFKFFNQLYLQDA